MICPMIILRDIRGGSCRAAAASARRTQSAHRLTRRAAAAVILAAALLFPASCARRRGDGARVAVTVTATTFPCYDAARAVLGGGDAPFSLKMLVNPGTEIHSYDPSPSDIIAVRNSAVFIYVGGESDEWVETVLNGAVKDAENAPAFVRLMDFVRTADESEAGIAEPEAARHSGDAENAPARSRTAAQDSESGVSGASGISARPEKAETPEPDEHIWTSPDNEILIVAAVREALSAAAEDAGMPELKNQFAENAEDYRRRILAAAEEIRRAADCAAEKHIVVADRFPLRYFADYYGLGYSAAFSGCSTAVEASVATVARLIDEVKTRGLPAVFYVDTGSHKIADAVAEAAGVPVLALYSAQNITKKDFDGGETWVSLMEKNAAALREGLR